jgi:hypothetical protein
MGKGPDLSTELMSRRLLLRSIRKPRGVARIFVTVQPGGLE